MTMVNTEPLAHAVAGVAVVRLNGAHVLDVSPDVFVHAAMVINRTWTSCLMVSTSNGYDPQTKSPLHAVDAPEFRRGIPARFKLTRLRQSNAPQSRGHVPARSVRRASATMSPQENRIMSKHVTLSPTEAADRLAIRELVEAYAHCADRRDASGQMALFTHDTHFVVYMDAKAPSPSQELHSREALAPVFADLNRYAATMHFLGQSTILSLSSDRATGEVYCMAHHVTVDGKQRALMVAALRYADTYVKQEGVWLYAERLLYVDWIEQRVMS
jgi:hypothetical protein